MDNETKGVETKVETAPAQPEKGVEETEQIAPAVQQPDYKALYEVAQLERDNYRRGLLKAKGKKIEPIEDEPGADEPVADQNIDDVVGQKVQETLALREIENPDERKLTKFYYDNKIVKSGDVDSDLELARAMANRQTILKTSKEFKKALGNRNQFSSEPLTSSGSRSAENEQEAGGQIFSAKQIAEWKAQGKTDKWIEEVKKNYLAAKNG